MKKIDLSNKKVIIFIGIIIVIIAGSLLTYHFYQKQELQKSIDTAIAKIEKVEKEFNAKKSKEDKMLTLQSLLKEHEKYEKDKDMINEVDDEYHSTISNMQKVFIKEYDQKLKENTLNDLDKIDDKEKLINAKSSLEDVLKTIKSEKDVVANDTDIKKYGSKINTLTTSYTERIAKIEEAEKKVEEERLAKEEEERKAQEEATKNNQSSSNNNYVGNNSGNSNSSNSGAGNGNSSNNNGGNSNTGGGTWHDGYEYSWIIRDDGVKIEFYLDRATGNTYDMNGNFTGNAYDW